jgi:hypothetical protein
MLSVPVHSLGHLDRRRRSFQKIGRVEVVFAGNSDECKQSISPRVGQSGSHAMGRCSFADATDWPIRGYPFAGGMGQKGRQLNLAAVLVDGGGLDRRDFMLAKAFAYNIEAAGERCIAKGSVALARKGASGWWQSRTSPGSSIRPGPLPAPQQLRRWIHCSDASPASRSKRSKLMAPDFERFARRPCPAASLASSGTSFFRSALAPSCS